MRSLFRSAATAATIVVAGLACNDGGTGPNEPVSLRVTPAATSIPIGATVQLTAMLLNASGDPLPTSGVLWTSSDSRVALVSAAGLVSAVGLGGPVSITATVGGTVARADVTVTSGPPSQISLETEPDTVGASGTALTRQPVVRLRDADGNEARQSGVVVIAVIAQGQGTLVGQTATTDALGIASFSDLALTGSVGSYRLRFESGALDPVTSAPIALGAGAPADLSFTTVPPATAKSGVPFAPQPRMLVEDAAGNPVPGASITASISSGQGALAGSTTAVSDGTGLASFTNLGATGTIGDLTLLFTAGAASIESGTISLGAGPAATLTVLTQPSSSAQSGVDFLRQPVVLVVDGATNPVPGVNVTASIETGGGVLGGGTTVVTDESGVAAFTDLSIVGAGGVRTLRFQSGAASLVSASIDLSAGLPALVTIQTQPSSSAQSGVPFVQQPVIAVTDGGGNAVPGYDVAVEIASGGGTLAGVVTAATDLSGVATFADLSIVGLVGPRTLRFVAGSAQAVANTTTLQAGPLSSLVLTQQPSNSATNAAPFPQQPIVVAKDGQGNPIAGLSVTAQILSGGGSLSGIVAVNTNGSGAATFTNLTLTGIIGDRTLRFYNGSTAVTSNTVNVAPGPPSSVVMVTQPPAVGVNGVVLQQSPQVDVKDVSGNLVPSTNVAATIAVGGGSVGGTTTVATNGSGRATFSSLSISGSPGDRTLRFTAAGAQTTSNTLHLSLAAGTYTDLQYCGSDPLERLDVYVPSNSFPRPRPVVAYVHGGGWTGHDKAEEDLVLWANVRAELLSRGYVVTTLNYRLGDTNPWPAQIHDVKCAVRHLRADGIDYGADGSRIGVWGGSAGGHLVSMLGVTDGISPVGANLEGTLGYGGVSSSVQAAITIGGISDMTSAPAMAELNFTGGETTFSTWPGPSTELTEASAVHWASADDPPFLIIHGQADTTVDPNQAERLNNALNNAGAGVVQIERVANGGHALEDVGGTASPSIDYLVQRVADFFDTHIVGP